MLLSDVCDGLDGLWILCLCDCSFCHQEEPAGYFVTRVTAVDSDDGLDGELVYGFLSNNALLKDHLKFRIDPDSGNITTAEVLDREKQETYQVGILIYMLIKIGALKGSFIWKLCMKTFWQYT